MVETERVHFIHTCAGNGCGRPVGSSSRMQAWVHEDGTTLCGAGLGVLDEGDWFYTDVPIADYALHWGGIDG